MTTPEILRELDFANGAIADMTKADLIRLVRLSKATIERLEKRRKIIKSKAKKLFS